MKKYMVISNVTKGIHEPMGFKLASVNCDVDIDEVMREQDELKLWKCFDTYDEGCDFLIQLATNETWKYTNHLRITKDFSQVTNRPFFAFLGEDITCFPGIYTVNREDYEKLSKKFSSVCLAKEHGPITKLLYPRNFKQIRDLNLGYLVSYTLSNEFKASDHEDIVDTIEELHMQLLHLTSLLGRIMEEESESEVEDAIDIIEDLFDSKDAEGYLVTLLEKASKGEEIIYEVVLDTSEIDPKRPETILTFI